MNADRRDVQFAPRGALVERLDVLEDVLEFETMRWNQLVRQGVEHERIVRVGRVAERERSISHGRKLSVGLD